MNSNRSCCRCPRVVIVRAGPTAGTGAEVLHAAGGVVVGDRHRGAIGRANDVVGIGGEGQDHRLVGIHGAVIDRRDGDR